MQAKFIEPVLLKFTNFAAQEIVDYLAYIKNMILINLFILLVILCCTFLSSFLLITNNLSKFISDIKRMLSIIPPNLLGAKLNLVKKAFSILL